MRRTAKTLTIDILTELLRPYEPCSIAWRLNVSSDGIQIPNENHAIGYCKFYKVGVEKGSIKVGGEIE